MVILLNFMFIWMDVSKESDVTTWVTFKNILPTAKLIHEICSLCVRINLVTWVVVICNRTVYIKLSEIVVVSRQMHVKLNETVVVFSHHSCICCICLGIQVQ